MESLQPTLEHLAREGRFQLFLTNELTPFWQTRQEWQFSGVDNIPVSCVKFTHPEHNKVIVIVSGFLESYIKYQELIYDLFQNGYDIYMFDNRGQGFSGRMLPTPHPVYVEHFSDYVDDLETFWQDNIVHAHYQQRYLLGHSMGGAITSLFLARQPEKINAVVLSAPMAGIKYPMPEWLAHFLIRITQRSDSLRKACVIKRKTPLPFKLNVSCHSEVRYQHFTNLFNQYPQMQLYGPTYHWAKEATDAGKQMIASAKLIKNPLLLLQAGKEYLVSNPAQNKFIEALRQSREPALMPKVIRFENAYHEILSDIDEIRLDALNQVISFFKQHE